MHKTVTKTRSGIVAALDIGTSKTCCIIARIDDAMPKVIGVGQHGSRGVKAGAVVDMEAAQQSILQAVHAAEQMAGETIRGVVVNLSGGHPSSRTSLHEISVAGHEISDADLRKVLTDGRLTIDEPADRTILHTIPVGFTIDGSRGIRDPRGMFGHRLGVHMHAVSASTGALKTLASCVSRCHLDIHGVVVSPYAAGLAALVEDERQLGVTLIDMGAGTTTLAVFFDGNLVFTDCVPIGGMHVTNDIARGLSTPLAHAERMKTLYGTALISSADEKEIIDVPLIGEDNHVHANHVPKSILTGIIQPRLEETFELVRSRLGASGFDKLAAPRAVLVGGGAQLQGVRDLAALLLDKTVRPGRPGGLHALADPFTGPAFTACAGLIHYTLQPAVEAVRRSRSRGPHPSGIFARLGLWLKENF